MKPINAVSLGIAAASTAAANTNVHAVEDLIARAMDPSTMDPTKLSVLSVLKTAIPSPTGTATNVALPTGNNAPQWYKDLPDDVMVLLVQMYPATSTAASVSEPPSSNMVGSSSSIQKFSASVATSQASLTRTLEPSTMTSGALATASASVRNGTVVSTGSLVGNSTNSTLPTTAPGLTLPGKSSGAKNTVGTGVWSVAVGLGVAATFCLFG